MKNTFVLLLVAMLLGLVVSEHESDKHVHVDEFIKNHKVTNLAPPPEQGETNLMGIDLVGKKRGLVVLRDEC